MGELSGVLQLTDLNDFIGPGQECVKPIQPRKIVRTGPNGSSDVFNNAEPVTNAQITLNDCLACSGCVTSAETVLIAEQSHALLLQFLNENAEKPPSSRKVVVVSIAPQVRASLAARFRLSLEEAGNYLSGMLKSLGVDFVFDVQLARNLSLLESGNEFIRRFEYAAKPASGIAETNNDVLPMIASACPGWVCYAEKSHGNFILPYIDCTKSPQQIMGSLVKYVYAAEIVAACRPVEAAISEPNTAVFHAALMPCYDKKLEASRADFYNDILGTRDVDMVITSIELEDLLSNHLHKQLNDFPSRPYDRFLNFSPRLRNVAASIDESASHFGGGAGGYCENVFVHAARQLFGQKHVVPGQLQYKMQRNQDFQDLILTVDGEEKLRFAICYGFRNIQNIVQKLKRNRCTYHYVEIMACPSACLNGGGQIRPYDFERQLTVLNDESARKHWLQHVQELYEQAPKRVILRDDSEQDRWMAEFYEEVIGTADLSTVDKATDVAGDNLTSEIPSENILHTRYHAIQRPANGLSIKW